MKYLGAGTGDGQCDSMPNCLPLGRSLGKMMETIIPYLVSNMIDVDVLPWSSDGHLDLSQWSGGCLKAK